MAKANIDLCIHHRCYLRGTSALARRRDAMDTKAPKRRTVPLPGEAFWTKTDDADGEVVWS
jgi:hypothetical protein